MFTFDHYAQFINTYTRFEATPAVDTDGLSLLKLDPVQGYYSTHVQIQVYFDTEAKEIIVASTDKNTLDVHTWVVSATGAVHEFKLLEYLKGLVND